jgi:branched-chain amino acid transport system ATP-binding protein
MTALLEASGLCKKFGGLSVTNNVALSLRAGARHALIGPNGAGKTTLVGLLSGALPSDAGQIVLAGHDITHEPPPRRVKRGLVRTFQVNNLFAGLTVLDNVLIALAEHRRASSAMLSAMPRDLIDAADARLGVMGLAEYRDHRVAELPYGPQRLLEIAIALCLDPKVLLLDEPAAGIPAADASRLLDLIGALPSDIAVLMIEHDMHVVRRFATEITVLVGGSILLSGPPDEVMASPEVHDVYLGRGQHDRPAGGARA